MGTMFGRLSASIALWLITALWGFAQIDGEQAYKAFLSWKEAPENRTLEWGELTERYKKRLMAAGMKPDDAAQTISIIASRDEGSYYDPVYTSPEPKFLTSPSKLLIEAVANRKPGRALDVGMGQGRNAVYLARLGWDVTGFDTSGVGLRKAREAARESGVKIRTVLASDEEFDFGTEQWDLIAILYPIEKRSVYRVRQALRPGGIVVVECSHKEGANAPFEYDTEELPRIFDGFRILKYQDRVDEHEWVRKRLRLVRLIAEK
jgi:SAM-dependent methyltransferase